eukprot:CAMPEP_0173375258 /NCGR_PEP_ID=MMETSP1144-20121109/29533_1 /TAXON_ID=483371 /ORGANISM="non described non described, Strain CCMP2298" /LENGTH=168 /DNA_ID=CAMNT_0014327683 /DNA_START=101 /DNA_END=605 /DNA_ORIENTATION=+
MSEVEETIERIKVQNGVEGYVICNKQGQVLRRFPTMSLEDAERYATTMISLTTQARGVVRDLDPKNELRYLRIRAKRHEIMVAFDIQFIVIVIQRWTASAERVNGKRSQQVALWFICSPVPVAAGIPVAAGDGDAGAGAAGAGGAEAAEPLTHRHICRLDAETEEERV